MKVRTEIDGTATVTLDDGRRFSLRADPDQGTLAITGLDGDLIVAPVSSDTIEIDTPFD